jgi:hypothetical protein
MQYILTEQELNQRLSEDAMDKRCSEERLRVCRASKKLCRILNKLESLSSNQRAIIYQSVEYFIRDIDLRAEDLELLKKEDQS